MSNLSGRCDEIVRCEGQPYPGPGNERAAWADALGQSLAHRVSDVLRASKLSPQDIERHVVRQAAEFREYQRVGRPVTTGTA